MAAGLQLVLVKLISFQVQVSLTQSDLGTPLLVSPQETGQRFSKEWLPQMASMMNTILAFRKGLIHSSDFEDEDSLRLHLLHLVNHVLGIAKKTTDDTDSNVSVDYGVVLGIHNLNKIFSKN